MSLLGAIGAGASAAGRNPGVVIWSWVGSLLVALPPALAAGWLVHDRVGASLVHDTFAQGADAQLWLELLRERGTAVAALIPYLVGAVLSWAVVAAFLGGAIISAVSAEEPPRTADLLSGGGRVFGRMIRLMFLGLPLVALVAGGAGFALFRGLAWLTEGWRSEPAVFGARAVAVLALLGAGAWAAAAYDLMKVEAVAKGEHRARYAFARGLESAVRRPLALLGLYLPFAAGILGITLAASLLDVRLPRSGWVMVAVGVLLQQAVALSRAWLRVAVAGAEVAWVRGARRR